jgi:glycosidase
MKQQRPEWNGDEIIYQIFPETFAIGGGRTIADKRDIYPSDAVLKGWDELPSAGARMNEFWGGDLPGITEKLDAISALGADTILLTSVCDSPSNHRYNIRDYRKVSPGLGTLADFDTLVSQAHGRGMKIIADMVFNHGSAEHQYFLDPARREWFRFHGGEYDCWRGHKSVPEWNLANPDVRRELFEGPDSALRFWLERGVDGIRLDCANDLGVEICRVIYNEVKNYDKDIRVYGEVFSYAARFAEALDGVQSYYLTGAIDSLLGGKTGARGFGTAAAQAAEGYPAGRLGNSFLMTASHDIPRAMTRYAGDLRKVKLAILLQFTLPGTPLIYYGEEAGMTGGYDPLNRAPMIWDDAKRDDRIYDIYRKMIEMRMTRSEWREGCFADLSGGLDNGAVVYIRYGRQTDGGFADAPGNFSMICVNPSDEPKRFRVHVPYSFLYDALPLRELLSGAECVSAMGFADIAVGPWEGQVWVPEPDKVKNYSFYKGGFYNR